MDDFRKQLEERLVNHSLDAIQLAAIIRKDSLFFSIADQYLRSATSIGANFFEARASSSRKDYIKFFQIALKSANETLYWLTLISRSFPHLSQQTTRLTQECSELSKILGSSVASLKNNP